MHACMHVCVCMYVCMYVRMYICMYACMRTCIRTYVYSYACIYVWVWLCVYLWYEHGYLRSLAPIRGHTKGRQLFSFRFEITFLCQCTISVKQRIWISPETSWRVVKWVKCPLVTETSCWFQMFAISLIAQSVCERIFMLTWWRHQMETFSALLDICAWNSPVTDEFPAQRPVTQSFDVFFDLRLLRLVIWDAIAPIMTSL